MRLLPIILTAVLAGLSTATLGLSAATATPSDNGTIPPGHHIFVDCSAPADGNGSAKKPLRDISRLNSRNLNPGIQVLFKRGTVCHGSLEITSSGKANHPIMLGAYGEGAQPVIQGGTSENDPAAITLKDTSFVTLQDLEVTGGYWQNIHVRSDNPHATMRGLTFRNLTLHDNAWTPSFNEWVLGTGGLIIEPCVFGASITDVVVDGIHASGEHETGVQIGHSPMAAFDPAMAGKHGMNTPGCHMDLASGQSLSHFGVTNTVVKNSSLHDNDASGAQVFYSSHITLQHNDLYDNGSGSGADTANSSGMNGEGAWWGNSDHVTAEYNNAYGNRTGWSNNDGSGLDPDVSTSQNLIQYNWLHDNQNYGVSLIAGFGTSQDTVIRYNVMSDNGTKFANAPDIMVSNPYHSGGVDGLAVYNNTMTRNGGGQAIRLQSNFLGTDPVTINNNIIYRTAASDVISTTTADATSDHNLFYSATGSPSFEYNGAHYVGLAAYQSATGMDSHSIVHDPEFASIAYSGNAYPMRPQFQPLNGSPADGMGTIIADNGGHDFYGAPFQSGQATTTVGAVLPGR